MASIIGEKTPYRNATDAAPATGKGWAVTDKIFGYLDKAGEIYNDVRYPKPGDADYDAAAARLRAEQAGIMGLPKPAGLLIIVGIFGLFALAIYKIAK
jgi:hypothetical protein